MHVPHTHTQTLRAEEMGVVHGMLGNASSTS